MSVTMLVMTAPNAAPSTKPIARSAHVALHRKLSKLFQHLNSSRKPCPVYQWFQTMLSRMVFHWQALGEMEMRGDEGDAGERAFHLHHPSHTHTSIIPLARK